MDISKVTAQQEYIIAKHSRMVGRVLDLIEAAIPEGPQCDSMKKLIQVPLYDFRNDMLHFITNPMSEIEN